MRPARPAATRLLSLAALLTLAPFVHAATPPASPAQTIPDLAKKADFLLVAQVTKIDDAGPATPPTSDAYKIPLLHKRATLRILRGIKSSDAAPVDFFQITVDYLAAKDPAAPDAPQFPQLQVGQISLFPVKAGADQTWRFIAEEDVGMIPPAATPEAGATYSGLDANLAFIYREIAGAFLYGDFAINARAAAYLDKLDTPANQTADPIFALIKAEIGDSSLREDGRWLSIAVASYIASGTPRPTLDALSNGMVAAGGGAARAPTDGLPAIPSLRLAALNLRKAGKFQLLERILMLLIAHQEDPGLAWGWGGGIAKALVDNFNGAPMMISMEDQAIRTGKPGAMFIADFMIKDPGHPLAAAAAAGARVAISPDGPARDIPDNQAFTPLLRQAEGLILRAGTDDDFAFFLDQINQAHLHDAKTYEAFLTLAGDSELSPTPRVLDICRQYIADTTLMAQPPFPGFRLCDLAALTAARLGKQDFGLSPSDPVEKRDPAILKAATWLNPPKRIPSPDPK